MIGIKNLRRASKESITIIKAREFKRDSDSFGGFKRKILSNLTDPPDLQVSILT